MTLRTTLAMLTLLGLLAGCNPQSGPGTNPPGQTGTPVANETAAVPSDWVEFKSPDGLFSIKAPGLNVRESDGDEVTYVSQDNNYTVVIYPSDRDATPEDQLKHAQKKSLEGLEGEPKVAFDDEFNSFPRRQWSGDFKAGKAEVPVEGVAVLVGGKKMLIASARNKPREGKAFVDSLQILVEGELWLDFADPDGVFEVKAPSMLDSQDAKDGKVYFSPDGYVVKVSPIDLKGKSPEDFLKGLAPQYAGANKGKVASEKALTVGGLPAYRFAYDAPSPADATKTTHTDVLAVATKKHLVVAMTFGGDADRFFNSLTVK